MNSNSSDNPYQASAQPNYQPPPHVGSGTDTTGGLIPYKNPHALIAYYLGLFSLFPLLGIFLSIPAFILGVIGLRNRSRNPQIRGSVHAWIGIIMGGLMTALWGATAVLILIAVASDF